MTPNAMPQRESLQNARRANGIMPPPMAPGAPASNAQLPTSGMQSTAQLSDQPGPPPVLPNPSGMGTPPYISGPQGGGPAQSNVPIQPLTGPANGMTPASGAISPAPPTSGQPQFPTLGGFPTSSTTAASQVQGAASAPASPPVAMPVGQPGGGTAPAQGAQMGPGGWRGRQDGRMGNQNTPYMNTPQQPQGPSGSNPQGSAGGRQEMPWRNSQPSSPQGAQMTRPNQPNPTMGQPNATSTGRPMPPSNAMPGGMMPPPGAVNRPEQEQRQENFRSQQQGGNNNLQTSGRPNLNRRAQQ